MNTKAKTPLKTIVKEQSYPATGGDHFIEIFTNGLPRRDFERVSIIDMQCEEQGFTSPTLQKAIPIFIKEAVPRAAMLLLRSKKQKRLKTGLSKLASSTTTRVSA